MLEATADRPDAARTPSLVGPLIVAFVLVWSPIKILAYFAPFAFLIAISVSARAAIPLIRLAIAFVALCVACFVYVLIEPFFFVQNALLAFVTYGVFVVLWAIPDEVFSEFDFAEAILKVVPPLILFEGCVGIAQAVANSMHTGSFDVANGDSVAGTIELSLKPVVSFGNPMFAVNMAGMLVALIGICVAHRRPIPKIPVAIGVLSFLLASVMHATLLMMASIGAATILMPAPKGYARRLRLAAFAALAGLFVFIAIFMSKNLGEIGQFYVSFITSAVPKAQMFMRLFTTIPAQYPQMPWYGFGPGQFASRAALIATGMFFGSPRDPHPLPVISMVMTPEFQTYALDLWMRAINMQFDSTTTQPFCSWVSFYSEFGGAGVVALGIFLLRFFLKNRIHADPDDVTKYVLATVRLSIVSFVFLLGMQENYWEVAQAIFVPCLLVRITAPGIT